MDPAEIPWGDHGVDVVIESTGLFTAREKAAGHLGGGVERVVISAPSGDADATICMGVNDDGLRRRAAHRDLERVVHHQLPGADGEGAQRRLRHRAGPHHHGPRVHERPALQDLAKATRSGKPDLRRMRAAALSIIPSSTGAARAIGLVLPELKGKLDGTSLRVPTPTGSITDLVGEPEPRGRRSTTSTPRSQAASNDASYRGVLEYSDEPLVSADIVGNPSSCIFSAERHDGERQDGQGARLVRQRVGLLEPPRRPRRVRRRQ